MAKIKIPVVTENGELKKEYTYSNENEHDTIKRLTIAVFEPYQIIDQKFVISTKLMNGQIDKDSSESLFRNLSFIYRPFEKFDIDTFLNTIMEIDLQNNDSIIDFYNKNGPLLFDGYGTVKGELRDSSNRMIGLHMNTTFESLEVFKEEIKLLQNLIRINDAINDKDEYFLRNFKPIAKYALLNSNELDPNISEEDLYLLAQKAVKLSINKKSNLINSVIELIDGEFTTLSSASCLLGVFYTRLIEVVTKKTKIRKCQYCGDYFKPRKDKSNFCPPPEANEKSKCLNRYDAMVRRIAKWHFKEELTLEEIQQKITKPRPRSIKEIQHILDNYNGKLKK